MIITRANIEAELIDRDGPLLALVGKDGATVDGTNASLNGALREGLISLSITPVAMIVADVDFTTITAAQLPQLCDVAELRLLKNLLKAYTRVDTKVGLGEQKLSQLRTDLLKQVEDMTALCKTQYGYGLGTITAGTFDLGFATTDPCATEPLWPFGGM